MYGDQDLISGYRMSITRSPDIQMAFCHLQQRKYLSALKCIKKCQDSSAKRNRPE